MEQEECAGLGDAELVSLIGGAVDALTADRLRLRSDAEQLVLLLDGLRLAGRLQGWIARLAAQVEEDSVAWREHGTSASTWLMDAARLTRAEAARLIGSGQRLARFVEVGAAVGSGTVSPGQAEAITAVLEALPEDMPCALVDEAQEMMIGFAATHNATELRRLSGRLLELLAPEICEEREAARLEREHAMAMRARHLTFTDDHRGSVLIKGSLPVGQAEPLVAMVDAWAEAQRRGLEALDPAATPVSPAMRRADGLIAMVDALARTQLSPKHGGDRPRVVVTLTWEDLRRAAGMATDGGPLPGQVAACGVRPLRGRLVGSGVPIDAGTLRRWLCDCEVLPVVLGGRSEVLDQGRAKRLVTDEQRVALAVRDGGCVFPGCPAAPQACHAHHIVPWWAGGPTDLSNLVLVCPHHHATVEPSHDPDADRWQVRLPEHGPAEVIPPRRVDPTGRPRRHARFLTPLRT
ncbi:HNH endonuclease signature motif containing protein [Propioniciclava soli]|uniref:HNH endonuclease signature motif containing protein n=1 Tax=Propioniciclava soli TaxID=2775081 RepID=UPI001E55A348|nr:HNH endonuclease signature motif containing protein [Propioniciclava soli]